jgi:hypothetical protein
VPVVTDNSIGFLWKNGHRLMKGWLQDRSERLCEFFKLSKDTVLLQPDGAEVEVCHEKSEQLALFNIEWHVIPPADAVPLDDDYMGLLYPKAARDFNRPREHKPSYRATIVAGHKRLQGRILGVETTMKPRYLPGNRQFYGTHYGFCAAADPFAIYLGLAGMTNGTRYDHNYLSLREFVRVANQDWRQRDLLPTGYRLTICQPAVFNLIGNIFHPEWSETESLELGFYRDGLGNAQCFAVGCSAPGDFSYISEIELGITPGRVQALIEAGRLPATKFGSDYMIRAKDLKLVEDRKVGRSKKSDKR